MKLNVSFRENNTVFGGVMSEMQQVTILDSPHFTGTPTSPPPVEGDNSEKIATTEFVQDIVSKYGNIVMLSVAEVTS